MKKLLLIILFGLGLSGNDLIGQDRAFTPKKIVFVSKTNVTDSSLNEIQGLIEAAINQPDSFPSKDSAYNSMIQEFKLSMVLLAKGKRETIIEMVNDTLWHRASNEFFRTNDTSSNVMRFPTENFNTAELQINKSDRKQVLGFDCYKVRLERPKIYDMGVDEGNEVIEMYVTDLVKLPASAVIHVNKVFHFFPLLIKSYNERTPLHFTTTEAISIDK